MPTVAKVKTMGSSSSQMLVFQDRRWSQKFLRIRIPSCEKESWVDAITGKEKKMVVESPK
jgi:hypothetical protein